MSDEHEAIKRDVTNIFSKVSDLYDAGRIKFFSDFGNLIVERMNLNSDARVLDIASGRGAILFSAYNKLGVKGKITGIDLSEGMVEKTSSDINDKKYNIDLLYMDAEKLDFKDNSFDYIFCGFALFFFPNLEGALSEIYRVLKPNGKFGASTFYYDPEETDWYDDLFKEHMPLPKESSDSKPETNTGTKPVFYTSDGMKSIFNNAGFDNIQIIKEDKDYYYSEDEWWNELFSHYNRKSLDKFSPEKLELFKVAVYKKLGQLKEYQGIHKNISVLLSYGQKS